MLHKWLENAVVEGKDKIIEVRKEDIWERRCRIIGRVGLELTLKENFDDVINKPCIFCQPERVAKFGKEFGAGMMENDAAFLFPNINPYARYSGVCAFRKHYIKMEDFDSTLIEKNLELGMEYIRKVEKMGNAKYASINWNYMMPAGASILHPHTQIIVDEHPTTYMEKIMEKREMFSKYIEMERNGKRYIGRVGKISLFTPFVPFGFNEIFGVGEESIEKSIGDAAGAIAKIISYYAHLGRNSFNMAIYMSLEDEFPLHFRCITRQNMVKYYRNDITFLERLHNEVILERKPEEIAEEMREYLKV